ncbi:MAG: cell division topological specificity factor MinE [Rhodocyclaceae bacterium]|jgi:cell division topological specificity factor|nr:cell division topological specificity factor MinE [Rhodocyclaceae bacterium]
MSLLSLIFGEKKKTAAVAKERLQLIIAREHSGTYPGPDFLPALQQELIEVISKYVQVNPQDIKVQLEKQDNFEILEVNIVLPEHPHETDVVK